MAKKKAAKPTAETGAPAEKPMTQREAVQKALDAGNDLPATGVPYVQEQFGITLGNQAFSTIKSKIVNAGKKKTKAPVAAAAARSTAPTRNGVAGQVEAIKALCEQLGADQVISIARLFNK